jgi:hypothetical protein
MICQTGLSIDYKLVWNEKHMIFLQLQRGKKKFFMICQTDDINLYFHKIEICQNLYHSE